MQHWFNTSPRQGEHGHAAGEEPIQTRSRHVGSWRSANAPGSLVTYVLLTLMIVSQLAVL